MHKYLIYFKYLLIIVTVISCNSCYVIKTYQIPRPNASELTETNNKIKAMLCIVNQCDDENFKYYILNGNHLTLKILKRNEAKIDSLMNYTFCDVINGANCTKVVLRLK